MSVGQKTVQILQRSACSCAQKNHLTLPGSKHRVGYHRQPAIQQYADASNCHVAGTSMGDQAMECRAQKIVDVLLVQVAGRIDHNTARAFEEALLPLLDNSPAGGQKVVLDLSGVAYMSSAGLRVLTLAAKQCRQHNGTIVIAALSPWLQEVFRISRFETIFTVFKSVPEALQEISPPAASEYRS
jgi:anti-anti-sigma factor